MINKYTCKSVDNYDVVRILEVFAHNENECNMINQKAIDKGLYKLIVICYKQSVNDEYIKNIEEKYGTDIVTAQIKAINEF